jgi:hypothetical protein
LLLTDVLSDPYVDVVRSTGASRFADLNNTLSDDIIS